MFHKPGAGASATDAAEEPDRVDLLAPPVGWNLAWLVALGWLLSLVGRWTPLRPGRSGAPGTEVPLAPARRG